MDAQLGGEHDQLPAGDQALHHLPAVGLLVGGEAGVHLVQPGGLQSRLAVLLEQPLPDRPLPLGQLHREIGQGVPAGHGFQLPLVDQLGQDGVRHCLFGVPHQLLPQLGHLHPGVEGICFMVLLQQSAAALPQAVQHPQGQIPAGQGLQQFSRGAQAVQGPAQLLPVHVQLHRQLVQGGQGGPPLRRGLDELLVPGAALLDGQGLQHRLVPRLVPPGVVVQHHPAADGLQGGVEPHHEPVPRLGGQLLGHAQLGVAALPGPELLPVQQHHLAQPHRRAVVQVDLGAGEDNPPGVFYIVQPHVQHPGHPDRLGGGHRVPPLQLGLFHPRQVHRHPLSGVGGIHILSVDLEVAHPGREQAGQNFRRVPHRHRPLDEGPGDHRAEAVHRKHPVDGQPEGGAQVFLPHPPHQSGQGLAQLGDALPGVGGHLEDGFSIQKGSGHPAGDVLPNHLHPLVLHHVALGDDYQPLPDAQQGEDLQVLHRLRHEALIGGHHQHGQVDAPRPGQHIFNKLLVAGHVHNPRLKAVLKIQMGEAQLDGDAPFFLLHQAVGVDPRQGLDQQGFAVVHVARGADDYMLHASASTAAWTRSPNSSSSRVRTSSR